VLKSRVVMYMMCFVSVIINKIKTKNSVAFSPQTNYTDQECGRHLLSKLVPTYAGRGCCMVSAMDSCYC
jgi:hypothetical protein